MRENMSSRKHRISKLVAALGGVGLLLGLSVPKAGAFLSTFSTKNYSGRYVCTEASDDDFFTAVIKYGPNGGGAFMAGTLVAAENNFLFPPVDIPALAFCPYELNLAASSYTISDDGHGFEQLTWTQTPVNANCPVASFTDQAIIALRNTPNAANQVQRADFSSVNLLGQTDAGHGTCYK
jgi:hypothetical protein